MPRLIADCPLCGGPVYDIEGQKNCASCKAELPKWFADVEPEYAPRMENTQIAYTEADKKAVRILRAAYMESTASDLLYNARQYLQDRARYERLRAGKVAA